MQGLFLGQGKCWLTPGTKLVGAGSSLSFSPTDFPGLSHLTQLIPGRGVEQLLGALTSPAGPIKGLVGVAEQQLLISVPITMSLSLPHPSIPSP